jgi:predicted transcriptional regulator
MPKALTTREAARRLGISAAALSRYVSRKKVFEPQLVEIGRLRVHSWTEEDVERLRVLLPKIANGRKTRHKKKQSVKRKKEKSKR